MSLQIASPFQQFFDRDGSPLDNGFVYVGSVNLNPETNPLTVYFDDALTIPAAQPLRTSNGYIVRNGSPARIYTSQEDFSLTVRNKSNVLVFTVPDATSLSSLATQLASGSGSSLVGYNLGASDSVNRTVQSRLRDYVSAKDFGAVGNGVANDTAAIQAFFSHVSANGLVGVVNPGTYLLTSLIAVANATPFAIFADQAKFVRGSDYGSVLSINTTNGWVIDGLEIDGGFSSFASNANHGIVWFNCSETRVVNCKVSNYKNTGIIGYTFPEDLSYFDNQVINCTVDGLDNANNGILLADLFRSGIADCNAFNIGKTGSPCYALQLKNGCQEGWIKGGVATGSSVGIAAGNSGPIEHRKNIISGVNVFDCTVGIAFGNAKADVFSDLVIDMNNQGNDAVDMNLSSVGCVGQNIAVHNLATNKHAVNFRSGDTDNVVKIASISNSTGLVRRAAQFLAGAERNTAQLDRYVNPTTVTSTTVLVTDISGVSTNRFDYGAIPMRSSLVIASDAITLFGPSVSNLTVDTEGAAATDDLVTINGGFDGQTVTIKTANNLRDVTVVHSTSGAGTIRLNGSVNFTLGGVADRLVLQYDGALQQWCETGRGDNV